MWFDFEISFLPSSLPYWAQSAYSVLYPSARSLLHIFLLPILSSFEGESWKDKEMDKAYTAQATETKH